MSDEEEDYEQREARTLGLERWVQFAFVAIAVITFFISGKLITFIWELLGEYAGAPKATLITAVAAVIGVLTGFLLYRRSDVKDRADEVAGELSKVTWPTREETWRNTVVTVVTSIIAAVYLGLFDTLWGTFTDLIYGMG